MLPNLASRLFALLLGAAFLQFSGCAASSGLLLSDLRLSSSTVAPGGRGDTPPIGVAYTLYRPATVTAYVVGPSDQRLYLRKDEGRPVAGEYLLPFNGAYAPDPSGVERRVLPAGTYKLVVDAVDPTGMQQQSTALVQVRDPDTSAPSVEGLAVFPDILSPNSDGIDDTTQITYRTTKQATVSTYLLSESGKRYLLQREERETPGEHSTSWDGQIGNQLLPSGSYQLVVEAEDEAGNVATAQKPLRLESASVPDAHLMSVSFDPQRVLLGDTLKVTIRVKNTGNTVLRTQGPDPGYVYDSQEGFSTIEKGAYRDKKGLWRVGVDWAGGPGSAGSKYPYRWGFGKDLQQGEEATVVGYIRLDHRYPQVWLYAGLVQEQVRYWDNEVGRTVIEISY